jgi:NAD(P)-dependent dehydrogenase (short-subunit alcohol dehydrogenase family)
MAAPSFDTDVPSGTDLVKKYGADIAGKVILTTGVSPGGLGGRFVEAIAGAGPALLILAGRNPAKTQATADRLRDLYPSVPTRTVQLDLESLAAVRAAAATVNGWDDVERIDVVVNNAAIMAVPYAVTADGFERQFATNHLGPFLFTNLIMGKVLASKTPRIVMVTSYGHTLHPIRWGDVNFNVSLSYLHGRYNVEARWKEEWLQRFLALVL